MADLACRGGGHNFPGAVGADIHCSDRCRNAQTEAIERAISLLAQNGFTRHEDTPNLLSKDGVSLSLEQVMHEGAEKALERHGRAVEFHRSAAR